MAESEEELRSLLVKVKQESGKAGLKINIQTNKQTTTKDPPHSKNEDHGIRETMESVTDFIFLGSKIAADGDCNHEIKRRLLLGRKAVTILDCVLKSRHHFADKILSGQSYDFSSSHVQVLELDHKES